MRLRKPAHRGGEGQGAREAATPLGLVGQRPKSHNPEHSVLSLSTAYRLFIQTGGREEWGAEGPPIYTHNSAPKYVSSAPLL